MFGVDFLYLVNIIVNFFTGYVEGNTYQYVVLDLRKICWKYITTWLFFDIASTIYFIPMLLDLPGIPAYLMLATKLVRLPCLINYMKNIMAVLQVEVGFFRWSDIM